MTADEELRDQLAEALVRLWGYEPDDVDSAVAAYDAADALLPVVRRHAEQRAAEVVRDFADLIDRGPTFPMPPSIFSAMARERADALAATDAD